MSKPVSVKKEIRFQQWVQHVREFNARPEGMLMTAWCKEQGISPSTFTTRLRKVQDCCLDDIQLSETLALPFSEKVQTVQTSFVEIPASYNTVSNSRDSYNPTAILSCRNINRRPSGSKSCM